MFRMFTRRLHSFTYSATNTAASFARQAKVSGPSLRVAGFAAMPIFMYCNTNVFCLPFKKEEEEPRMPAPSRVNPQLIENPRTIWEKIRSTLAHTLRLFQLILIFLPSVLTFPLKLFKPTEVLWLKMFVWSIEQAGVVWIKVFQYLSHRRDVIGEEMANNFNHLREHCPQHSFEETQRNFRASYGKQINQIFDSFDQIPIASGSVSQVYKAVYRGKKVAVKVRHPDVDKYIQRDVNIMFGISKVLSIFSKSYEIPVGESSLKKTLIDQIDFNIESDNLVTFNNHFSGNQTIQFPKAFEKETRDSILIESFVEGVPVTDFDSKHELNEVIARLGASAFFEMLMKNNFVHADCHGGNILVEVTKQSITFFGEIKNYLIEKYCQLEATLMQSMLESEGLRALYKSSCDEEKRIRDQVRSCTDKVKLNVIDVGMVIKLDDHDRLNFTNFLKSIMEGNGQNCADMIYRLSNFNGHKILEGKYEEYKSQLSKLFSVLDKASIFEIEGISLLLGMLNIIRDNNMKLDGEFATLITNMVVLESIAKDIDPDIQVLKCAIPFFKFVEDPNGKDAKKGDNWQPRVQGF